MSIATVRTPDCLTLAWLDRHRPNVVLEPGIVDRGSELLAGQLAGSLEGTRKQPDRFLVRRDDGDRPHTRLGDRRRDKGSVCRHAATAAPRRRMGRRCSTSSRAT